MVETTLARDGTPLRYGLVEPKSVASGQAGSAQLVFVPGLGGTLKAALSFFDRVVPHVGPLLSLDARGFGLNAALAPDRSPKHYWADLQCVWHDAIQKGILAEASQPVWVGISFGGVQVVNLLTQAPFFQDRASAVVLMAPAFCPHPRLFTWRYRLQTYARILTGGLAGQVAMPFGLADVTQNPVVLSDPTEVDQSHHGLWYLLLVDLACRRAQKQAARLTHPVAMVIPEADRICDPAVMAQFAQACSAPNTACWTYPAMFHDVLREPEPYCSQVLADLLPWLSDRVAGRKAPLALHS